jgi:RHS repeat-associated protein
MGHLSYYRHGDWLGSSRLATTPSRTSYSNGSYAPFGEDYAGTGTTDLSFTGQNQDTISGLYDFMYRRYNPVQGRWISPDPAGIGAVNPADPQTWNRYAYVGNSPLNSVDSLGLTGSGPDFTGCGQDPQCYAQRAQSFVSSFAGGTYPSDWCFIDGAPAPCSMANGLLSSGSATFCPTGTCLFTKAGQGPNGTTIIQQLVPASNSDVIPNNDPAIPLGQVVIVTTAYWKQIGVIGDSSGSFFRQLMQTPWSASWVLPLSPAPGAAGVGPAGSVAWNPATKTLCLSIGAGLSVGDNLSVGPVTGRTLNGKPATPSQINKIFGGWSVNFGGNVPMGAIPVGPGGQVSINGSGVVYGPTVGVAGASLSSTYAFCGSF